MAEIVEDAGTRPMDARKAMGLTPALVQQIYKDFLEQRASIRVESRRIIALMDRPSQEKANG